MDNDQLLDKMFKDRISKGVRDELIIIVDRSGSMSSIRDEAEGGVNGFIDEQKKLGHARITIVEFDNERNIVCERVNIEAAPTYSLAPRGMTALLDAIGFALNNTASDIHEESKKIAVIVTDGFENCSREFTHESISKLIKEKEEQGWEFLFLAANQDAIATGQRFGMKADQSVAFKGTGDGITRAYNMAASYTSSIRTKSIDDAYADLETLKKKLEEDDSK